MSLLSEVTGRLREGGAPFALIGAEALALHGVSRATADRDLLTTDYRVLRDDFWEVSLPANVAREIRLGDADDPLAGVVRFRADGERPVDLVVGRHAWQERLLARAEPVDLEDAVVGLARPADLILLKLYAGGPQDLWDVRQLLAREDRDAVVAEVDGRLPELPRDTLADCRDAWRRALGE